MEEERRNLEPGVGRSARRRKEASGPKETGGGSRRDDALTQERAPIYEALEAGGTFEDALRTRTFEPDGPNYTPRISAVVYADGSYQMSILKSADGNGDSVQRYFFDYPQPVAGEGHFISTYKHNGNPIPSFEGEPLRFACPRTIGDFAHGLWQNLNPDNKVSLFARVIDLDSGETGDMIFNKYDAVNSDLDDPEEPELLPEELELLAKLDAEAE